MTIRRTTPLAPAVDLRHRDALLKSINARRTPAERLEVFAALQRSAFSCMHESSRGWRAFLRRNLHSRQARCINGVWEPISADRNIDRA
jgi:hypothetical protein